MSKVKDLVRKGSFLVVISVVIKFIGLIYRIPLTNLLGDTGNGYYGLAFLIYSYFIILSSTGASDTMARMISERLARQEYANARQVFRIGLLTSGSLGLISALLAFFGADFIADTLYHTPQAALSIRALAPAVLMVPLSSVFRGLYQGLGDVRPSAYADLLDQVLHAGFSILLVWIVLGTADLAILAPAEADGLYAYASSQAAMASMYGAMAGLLFLLALFVCYRAKSVIFHADMRTVTEKKSLVLKSYIWVLIPIMVAASVSSLRELIDTGLFNALMPLKGYSAELINAERGMLTGKYNVMTNMPIAALGTMTYVLVPGIARAITKKDFADVEEHITTLLKLVALISIPAAAGLSALGPDIVRWLFANAPEGGELLRYGSLIVIFYSISQNASGILQGLGKIYQPVKNALKSICISVPILVLSIFFLDLQVYAMIVSATVFSFCLMFFNLRSVLKYSRCTIDVAKIFVTPVIVSVLMGGLAYASHALVYAVVPSQTVAILAAIILSVLFYFLVILNTNWLSADEVRGLPMGKVFVKLRFRKDEGKAI